MSKFNDAHFSVRYFDDLELSNHNLSAEFVRDVFRCICVCVRRAVPLKFVLAHSSIFWDCTSSFLLFSKAAKRAFRITVRPQRAHSPLSPPDGFRRVRGRE